MKVGLSAIAVLGMLATPVGAAPANLENTAEPITLAVAPAVDPQSLALAREFIAMLYPTAQQDALEQLRASMTSAVEGIENQTIRVSLQSELDRVMIKAMPKVQRRVAIVMEAYAGAYAREYSAGELREMIIFGASPAGRHFLNDLDFGRNDADVTRAREAMWEEVLPMFEGVAKTLCQRATEARIAAGDTKAKCSRA